MGLAEFDHIVVSAATLDEGVAYVEAALGVSMSGGGEHKGLGSHNKLLSLGSKTYLEVIAPNPDDQSRKTARMFDLDNFYGVPRLSNWVIRTKSISTALATAPDGIGEIRALSRGDFSWLMTLPKAGKLPFSGAFPAFIEWQTLQPAPLLPDVGCRLQRFEITHPDADSLSTALAPFLNDARLVVKTGSEIRLYAEVLTPKGICVFS